MAASLESCEDWTLLRNAVREPVRQLIAVEVDTVARAREAIAALQALDNTRPSAVVEFDVGKDEAENLLTRARTAIAPWPGEAGLVCVLDTPGAMKSSDDDRALKFWQGMNLLREKWHALDAQIIFFLLPYNYRYLTKAADHLKRWMSLKVHLFGRGEPSGREEQSQSHSATAPGLDLLSPEVAMQQLITLEQQLQTALRRGEPVHQLVRRYYLPMLAAAISLNELNRALILRDKAAEFPIADADMSAWLRMNATLELGLFHLDEAKVLAERLLKVGRVRGIVDDIGVAYFYLARVAEEMRDFAGAEKWYHKALEIHERQGDEHNAAGIYHQLGIIAQEQRDLKGAEKWYHKALEIRERQGNEHGAASTYHELGRIAQEQREFEVAEAWYVKSLEIKERHGNEYGAASTQNQLGRIAQEQRKFGVAEAWYRKSLEITVRQGNEHGAAITYHQLGRIAHQQHEYEVAKEWYHKSLEIEERQSNDHGAAITYGQLGVTADLQGDVLQSGHWLIKAISAFARSHDERSAQGFKDMFLFSYQLADAPLRVTLQQMWEEAGLGQLPPIESAEADQSSA